MAACEHVKYFLQWKEASFIHVWEENKLSLKKALPSAPWAEIKHIPSSSQRAGIGETVRRPSPGGALVEIVSVQ